MTPSVESILQGANGSTPDPQVRDPEFVRCCRCEGAECPKCGGSGFRERKHCAGCGVPAGRPSQGGKALSPESVARRAGRSLGPFRSTAWIATPTSSGQGWRSSRKWAATMAAHSLCRECDGTGWIPYYSETVEGELEEAYRLCPGCYAPRYCMGSKTSHPCPRPGTVRYGLRYYCKEHVEVMRAGEEVDHAYEAIYYLKCWLWIARNRANGFLEMHLGEALSKAETQLRRTERELD